MNNTIELSRSANDFNQLNTLRNVGIITYGLEPQDVHSHNFGKHTLNAIKSLINQGQAQNNQEAFEMVRELDEVQTRGVIEFELDRDQVSSPNFGEHTLQFIYRASRRGKMAPEEAFNAVQDLNPAQIQGIHYYDLSPLDVQTLNFGQHTLGAMQELMKQNRAQNYPEAFEKLREMDEPQTRGIIQFNLDRNQVAIPNFSELILPTIEVLQSRNPKAERTTLYKTATALSEMQLRGIAQNQLSLEQVGIGIIDANFQNQEPQDSRFSGATVDAQAHLTSVEGVESAEAYSAALNLDSTQITGMIDFGLRYDQIHNAYFKNINEPLAEVANSIKESSEDEEFELKIPLDNEADRQQFRDVFDTMSRSYETKQQSENSQISLRKTENELTSAPIETTGVAAMPHKASENMEEMPVRAENVEARAVHPNYRLHCLQRDSDDITDNRKPAAKKLAYKRAQENAHSGENKSDKQSKKLRKL